jgi:hypothetical protein
MPTKFLDNQPTCFVSRVAVGAAAAHSLVKFDGDTFDVTSDGEFADGVLLFAAQAGDECRIACGGILPVVAGATISPGDWLVPFDSGVATKPQVNETTHSELLRMIGFAITQAAPAELVMVYWSPHTVWGWN